MKNAITINQMMAAATALKEKGERFSLLGIGPMSKTLIYAVLDLAKERDFPVMLIASRNQVDSDEFGHGYVCDWDQDRFAADVENIAKEVGFDGYLLSEFRAERPENAAKVGLDYIKSLI